MTLFNCCCLSVTDEHKYRASNSTIYTKETFNKEEVLTIVVVDTQIVKLYNGLKVTRNVNDLQHRQDRIEPYQISTTAMSDT